MTDHNEAMRLADLFELEPDPESLYRQAAALLRQQAERIAELEAENGKLRDGLAKGLSEKTMITELAMRNGGLYAGIEGGAAAVLASAFAEQFTSSGGVNYVEVSFMHPATGPICVTLQRVQGKTPHQLRREAEVERDRLLEEVERLRADEERIDYLECEANELRTREAGEEDYEWVVRSNQMDQPYERDVGSGKTIREAIDAARTQKDEG